MSNMKKIEEILAEPEHATIKPQCFTCEHFPVCQIRTDYLKVAILIADILGAPADKYELIQRPFLVPGFVGTPINNAKEYFPKEIHNTVEFSGSLFGTKEIDQRVIMIKSMVSQNGEFHDAKIVDTKHIQFIYIFGGVIVLFSAVYNDETEKFDFKNGKDVYYNLPFEIDGEFMDDMQAALLTIKKDEEERIENEKKLDIINTTPFSSCLICDHYTHIPNLSFEQGVHRMFLQYPNGIPLGDEKYYHIATYHRGIVEPRPKVYYPPKQTFAKMPVIKWPVRRDDQP